MLVEEVAAVVPDLGQEQKDGTEGKEAKDGGGDDKMEGESPVHSKQWGGSLEPVRGSNIK